MYWKPIILETQTSSTRYLFFGIFDRSYSNSRA